MTFVRDENGDWMNGNTGVTDPAIENGTIQAWIDWSDFSAIDYASPLVIYMADASGPVNASPSFWNFGQQPFEYSTPAGYTSLSTFNVQQPSILKGDDYCDVIVAPGASILSQCQSQFPHGVYMIKDITQTETNGWQILDPFIGQTGSTGSLHLGPTPHLPNPVDTPYSAPTGESMAICWGLPTGTPTVYPAGTNGATTASEVISYPEAGFSIFQWTNGPGNPSYQSVNHGLGTRPDVCWFFQKDDNGDPGGGVDAWLGTADEFFETIPTLYPPQGDAQLWLPLNSNGDMGDRQVFRDVSGNPTPPTDTLIRFESEAGGVFHEGDPVIAYCWNQVPGFSKFGIYKADDDPNGPFVYTGFSPKFVIIKAYGFGEYTPWTVFDTTRSPNNPIDRHIPLNTLEAETSDGTNLVDVYANGFKIRSADHDINFFGSEGGQGEHLYVYWYMAFAEFPFAGACTAQATARV